ncbi:MAG: 50S ribosomal protein L22 [Coxiella-like endosymbiont]
MEISAIAKYVRISDQKVRLVGAQIRGLSAEQAVDLLRFSNKKSAAIMKKVLDSAIANAEHNAGIDIDELKVSSVMVDKGPMQRRFCPRARGRVNRILKRTCYITVKVANTRGRGE